MLSCKFIYCVLLWNFISLSASEKEFRMQKLNLVWEKASKKLSKEKLKSLFTDLKYQDKEEIGLKKLKVDNLDKSGMKEALIRGSFNAILRKYGLEEDFEMAKENFPPESDSFSGPEMKFVFKDKKLNKLWLKAEKQGFSEEQLNLLKEEFNHHQTKIDQYYQLMDKVNHGSWHVDDPSNSLSQVLDAEENTKKYKEQGNPHQVLKEKHSALKSGYDYLTSKVKSVRNAEFDEPQVNSLWEIAKSANFTEVELESLKGELHHFEHRIKKFKHLSEMELKTEDEANIVDEELSKRQKKLKHYQHKVNKVEAELRERIVARHTEL